MEEAHEILTVSEAAKRCGVNRNTIWRWIKAGEIRSAVTAGGHHRIHREDLEHFLEKNRMKPQLRKKPESVKILLVDDDPQILKLLSQVFVKEGYAVDCASDGFEAGVKMTKSRPDLIVLDIFMPNMDGCEVCKSIRNDPDLADIKIIAVSGNDPKESEKLMMGCGADRFIEKPIDQERLLQEVESLLHE